MTCFSRGFILLLSGNFEPEGNKPYFIMDSKILNFVPCYPTTQLLFISEILGGKNCLLRIIFLSTIKELYSTKINFWANPFSKREWKNDVILSFSLFKI